MKRTGGGGAWRAFLHCRCQGQLVRDFSALAVQYGALSAEELEHFRILGRDGSKIHRYGGRSFGPRLATVEKLIEYKKMAEKGEAVLCNALVQSAQSALALPDTLSDAALGQSMNKTRGRAIRSMNTPIGKFSQYKDGSLVATCPIVECGQRCRLTKRLYASNDGKNPGQGRPIGLMYAWLQVGHEEHVRDSKIKFSFKQRCDARDELLGLDGGKNFAELVERKRFEGEGLEPELIS